jgi:SAM-dependent methyltransferase
LVSTGQPEEVDSIECWDRQIRIFARVFLDNARLPTGPFTLLDVGCGTGSALREVRLCYPKASLSGCDVEQEHVDIATRMNGDVASFFKGDLLEIGNDYDVMYVSNVVEHVEYWSEAIVHLARHARRVYILVPYNEALKAPPPEVPPKVAHVASFDRESFDFVKKDRLRVRYRIVRTPDAWGERWAREIRQRLEAFLGLGPPYELRRQLLVSLSSPAAAGVLPANPFRNRVFSEANRWKRSLLARIPEKPGPADRTRQGPTA